MLGAISTAISVAGVVTSTTTSWLTTVVALAVTLPLWAYEKPISTWVLSKTENGIVNTILSAPLGRRAIQVFVGFVFIWIAIIFTNISILRPKVFVGYTDQAPFRFGRYIASISRSAAPQGGYCPHVDLMGTILNTSGGTMRVWYAGDTIKVWSQDPPVTYDSRAEINGIGLAGGGYSDIAAGSLLTITISAEMNPSLCNAYTASDLAHLRHSRINVTTAIHVSNPEGKGNSLQPIVFQDLPIATGA